MGGSLSGQIEAGNDVDYFRVQVDGSGVLRVYTAGNLDTLGTLQDSSGSPLGNQDDDSGDGSNFRIERTVNAGAYYVKVESYGSGTGSYTLHADFSAAATRQQVSIADAEATEGNPVRFTVTLNPAPTRSVTFYYATYRIGNTVSGLPGSGQDYEGKFATPLTFGSGQTNRTISISTLDDTEDESDEQFYVYITDASGKLPQTGTPSDYLARAIGTIRDDDETTDDHSNTLAGATILTLGGSQPGQIETGNDVDYFQIQVGASGVLTVETTGSLDTLGTLRDSSGSPLENDDDSGNGSNFRIQRTVNAGIYHVEVKSYGATTGSYTLHASLAASAGSQVSIADAEATEGSPLHFTVTLNPAPARSVTFYYATYRLTATGVGTNRDYAGVRATALTFDSGESSQTITIPTIADSADESDEQFYVYLTDAPGKHPVSGTPSDYLARATGTIRDGGGSTGLTRLYWEIAGGITGGAELTISAGQPAKMVAVFDTRPSGTFTFKIYEADVSGGQLVQDATVSPISISASAANALRDGDTYKLSASWTSVFRAGTESVSPDQAEYYFTVEQGGSVLRSMLDDANARTGIFNKVGPLLSVESSAAERPAPTPPTPAPPSGKYTYTFSLDNETYKVSSDYCYRQAGVQMEAYISGLRIYNNHDELIRPPDDTLFQLTTAQASACVIDSIDFEETQSILNRNIKIAQGYAKGILEAANDDKAFKWIMASISVTVGITVAIFTGGAALPVALASFTAAAGIYIAETPKKIWRGPWLAPVNLLK